MTVARNVQPVTLGEGDTPLIPAPRLAHAIGASDSELYLKYEGLNPTGSFKDRGMTAAITQAIADGARAVVCASTGNTAASAAAYSARAGLRCVVLVPEGQVALGKLAGALAYGAEVVSVAGSFDQALCIVRELGDSSPLCIVNSINPFRIQGQKTAAWEISEALGTAPDWLCLPVGNAGNITSYWLGFREESDEAPRTRMLGVQAEGAAPIVHGKRIVDPQTRATAIRIGNPARWTEAQSALDESHGLILAVTDDEIFSMYHACSELEGVFCEPSSAAGIAGLRRAIAQGLIDPAQKKIVCVLTGHGLKDPDSALAGSNFREGGPRSAAIPATTNAFLKAVGLA